MAYTTIKKPSDYFNTILWTGNSGSQTISGYGFQPDFLWTKLRSHVDAHQLRDAVRGINKVVRSNTTGAEYTVTSAGTFNSDGFTTVGTDGGEFNYTGYTYASWGWLGANGTASNTDGSITSTVSANTTSGFSIVSYTGTGANATVGHGLGIAPKFLIVKNRSSVTSWGVQTSTGAGFEMNLNNDEAQTATSVYWNSTNPTSSVFSVGTNAATNNSGDNMIAYCFAEVKGFSKFGSYEGNGNVDGPFIYTGFKPAFVLIKKYSAANDWYTHDNKRDTFNPETRYLQPNTSAVETNDTGKALDFLSNGFKLRTTHGSHNGATGQFFIYMAFAEEPLVGDNPATAR
jgi:hypothetical protein